MFKAKLQQCHNLLTKSQLRKNKLSYIHYRLFEVQLNLIIREDFVNKFWSYFNYDTKVKTNRTLYIPFLEAVEFLDNSCKKVDKFFQEHSYHVLREKFFDALKIQILSQKPYYLKEFINATYLRAFKTFLTLEKLNKKQNNDHEDEVEENQEIDDFDFDDDDDYDVNNSYDENDPIDNKESRCYGCSRGSEECKCDEIYNRFCKLNEHLRELQLLQALVDDTIMFTARIFIERKVSSKCKSNYSFSYLGELTEWVHDVVKRWIIQVYGTNDTDKADNIKLNQFLKDAYADVRVSHMFEIIIEYPNSEAAIQDLKVCLEQSTSSNFRLNLIDSVRQSLIESLLHPGVNTYDILTAYISAIKALRALDPTGLILQLVTEPVRRYLKSREDTVRCIVTALTDEDHNSELNREMVKGTSQTNENGIDGRSGTIEMSLPSEGEKCTSTNFEKWKPDPIKLSGSDDMMKSSRFSDIVSILVNIYETKDLFVEEYQKLLSQRLLNKYDECNLDTELRNLELLTIRFSDCELHRCEVMLKDVQTSKRINKRILTGDINEHKLEEFKNLDVLIVSSPFWPDKFGPMASISDETPDIKFPTEIQTAIDTYTKAFEAIQASRTLHWRHHLGSVNLDLTINGKIHNFTVSPLHAAILYLFKERKSWRLNELMHKTSLPAATLRSRLALWQRNGLIDLCEDRYDLITN